MPPILAARLLNTIQEPKSKKTKERMRGPLDLGFILKRRGERGDGGRGGVLGGWRGGG